jgi:hypothetical protein
MTRLFERYGAELSNLLLGLAAIVLLGLLRLAGVVSFHTWWLWSALSLSFVVLPLVLIGLRQLFPALSRSMEIAGPDEVDKAERPVAHSSGHSSRTRS